MLSVLRRLVAFFRRNRLDDDLVEEIRLHLELRKQALIAAGMAPADADHEARRQFGNVTPSGSGPASSGGDRRSTC